MGRQIGRVTRQKITRGEFAPGQRLSEQALSESLGISRNTLREVFRMLTKDGLILTQHTGLPPRAGVKGAGAGRKPQNGR